MDVSRVCCALCAGIRFLGTPIGVGSMNGCHLAVGFALLALGCQGSESGDCKPGFIKKQGRWCVFDEELLGLTETSDGGGSSSSVDGGGDNGSSGGGADNAEEDEEYIHNAPEPEVAFTLVEIREAMEEAIRIVRWIDPGKVHVSYAAVEALGDEECPEYDDEYFEDNDRYRWRDACSLPSGAAFAGNVTSYDYGAYMSENTVYDYGGHAYFSGSARISDDRGNTFVAAGSSNYWERKRISTGDGTFYQNMSGNFRFDDSNYYGSWLGADLNVSVYHYSDMFVDDGDHYGGAYSVYWNASISGIVGEVSAVRLDDVYMYSENLGSMCGIEPSGTIAVRDAEGNWYEAEFDGPKYYGAGAFPPDCDSCGRVYWRGELLGTVCPDFGLLVDWESRPWL
jgi:hypothetical protein